MTISLQSTISKPSPCKNKNKATDSSGLKAALENILRQKNEYDKAGINWIDDENVEIHNVSNPTLNCFLLEAERQGKDISFTKQTVITIS